jgi:hypothetical protein
MAWFFMFNKNKSFNNVSGHCDPFHTGIYLVYIEETKDQQSSEKIPGMKK